MTMSVSNPRTTISRKVNPAMTPEMIGDQILATAGRPLSQGMTFPPAAYTDEGFYEFEVENILKREWHAVGHVSQIPNPGDYFNLELIGGADGGGSGKGFAGSCFVSGFVRIGGWM